MVINAAWGLGEYVVQGTVDPDEYVVFKPLLERSRLAPILEKTLGTQGAEAGLRRRRQRARSDVRHRRGGARAVRDRATTRCCSLARWAVQSKTTTASPMDIEWAKDGRTGELFIVQARPETVQARSERRGSEDLRLKSAGPCWPRAWRRRRRSPPGRCCVMHERGRHRPLRDGAVLVTEHDRPRLGADHEAGGGDRHRPRRPHLATRRSSAASWACRRSSAPATPPSARRRRSAVTVSCAEGDVGLRLRRASCRRRRARSTSRTCRETAHQVMLNLANPAAAFRWWRLPADGIGLARMEFIDQQPHQGPPDGAGPPRPGRRRGRRREIDELTAATTTSREYFVDRLAHGIARIARLALPGRR